MNKLLVLCCFVLHTLLFFAQKNSYSDSLTQIFSEYDYFEEMTYKDTTFKRPFLGKVRADSTLEYPIFTRAKRILQKEDFFEKISSSELYKIAAYYLKKRAILVYKDGCAVIYFCNLRMWPGELTHFFVNIVSNIEYDVNTTYKEFISRIKDYTSVERLLAISTNDKKIDDEFEMILRYYDCE